MDSLEEDSHPIHNIKSNVQYASGHKFDSSSRVILVKNLKRNGDFNEGLKDGTSSGSKFEQSPRIREYENFEKYSSKEDNRKKIEYSYDKPQADRQSKVLPKNDLIYENENELRMKIDFEEYKGPIKSQLETDNIMMKIRPLKNLESLSKGSPQMTSSRRDTARKEELETETLHLVATIRNSFNTKHCPPDTQTTFYKVGRVLGKGAFGKVNLAMHLLAKR